MSKLIGDQVYYGWKIVAAILVLLTFSSGLSFYNHAIYLNALASQPAFNVQTASFAVSIFFLSGGITGLGVAKWVQDYDPRYCIIGGAIISCIALTALAYVDTVWQLFLVYAFFGCGFSASSLIPATTLVTRWFRRKRAMALSIASTGLSLGGVILTPLSVILVDSVGFARATPVLGVVYLLGVIPVTWIWLRPSPESMGVGIDGDPIEAKPGMAAGQPGSTTAAATAVESGPGIEASGHAVEGRSHAVERSGHAVERSGHLSQHAGLEGISFRDARRERFFWGVSLAYIFLLMAQVGGIAHQYGLARELLSESSTAIAVAILPVASIIGRLIGGWAIDRMSIRVFAVGMMVLQAASLGLLSAGFSIITLCLGLALFGTTVGNLLMLQPLLIAEAFGVKDYARIFSVCNLMSSWGTAIGPALLGLVYAASQNAYALSYTIAAIASCLGLVLFLYGGRLKN
jgi:MFS family permease